MKIKKLLEQLFLHTNYDEFEQQNISLHRASNDIYLLTWKTKYFINNGYMFFNVNFWYNIDNSQLIITASSAKNKDGLYNYELNELFFNYLFVSRFKKYGFKVVINNNFNKIILKLPDNLANKNLLARQFENNLKNFLMRILIN